MSEPDPTDLPPTAERRRPHLLLPSQQFTSFRRQQTHLGSQAAVELLSLDIERLRDRCERLLQSGSGFSNFPFAANPSSSSSASEQPPPQPPDTCGLGQPDRMAPARWQPAPDRRPAPGPGRGASRSIELPDTSVNGIGVSLTRPPPLAAQLAQARTQDLQRPAGAFLLAACSVSVDAASDTLSDSAYPPITESQMIGSTAANQATPQDGDQSEPGRQPTAPNQQQRQSRRSSNTLGTATANQLRAARPANQARPEDVAEKYTFPDPSVGGSQPFLQRIGEFGALVAETMRHEKLKSSKRKLRY